MNSTNITNIAFEQIANDYYWGKYGEFKVIINKATGYINATHLCGMTTGANGTKKEFRMWRRNASSDELIDEISSYTGICKIDLFKVVVGGHLTIIRGTYAHSKLIPHVASWVSPKFAVAVMDIVETYIIEREITRRMAILGSTEKGISNQLRYRANLRDNLTNALLPSDRKLGCVYFVSSGECTKIGYTYDMTKRMCSLQTGNPVKLVTLHTIITPYPERVEKDLHDMFASYRVSGEWFKLPNDAIESVKIIYNE